VRSDGLEKEEKERKEKTVLTHKISKFSSLEMLSGSDPVILLELRILERND